MVPTDCSSLDKTATSYDVHDYRLSAAWGARVITEECDDLGAIKGTVQKLAEPFAHRLVVSYVHNVVGDTTYGWAGFRRWGESDVNSYWEGSLH